MLFYSPTKYGSDHFRQIFNDHWERWWDYCREEIPADQRSFVQKVVKEMMDCRNPNNGFARYVCPNCYEERLDLSLARLAFAPAVAKSGPMNGSTA